MGNIEEIVKSYLAGKEEGAPLSGSGEVTPEEKKPAAPDVPPINIRHYFFTAGEPIDYKSITSKVEQFGTDALDNIKQGLQGTGDNFKWNAAVLKTNEYSERPTQDMVLYVATLTSDGKQTNQEQIIDKSGKQVVNGIQGFPQDILLKTLRSKMFDEVNRVKFDDDAKFLNKEFSPAYTRMLLTQNNIPGDINWAGFKENYSGSVYRLWNLKGQKLETPVFTVNNNDNFLRPGNPFYGTAQDIKALEQRAQKATPEEKGPSTTPITQDQEKKEPSVFKPVDEQQGTNMEQAKARFQKMAKNIVDSKLEEYKKEDPDVNYYRGDFSMMQDLVRQQHKKMKIRKEAQTTSYNPAQTNSTSKKNQSQIQVPITLDKPGVDKADKQIKKLKKVVEDLSKAQTQSQQTQTSPYGTKGMQASVDSVINFFLSNKEV